MPQTAGSQNWKLETRNCSRLRFSLGLEFGSRLMTPKIDRRSRERVVAKLPVRVRGDAANAELSAQTRDVSTNGVFLYTNSRMMEGSDVELVLILPPELTSGEKCWVCSQGVASDS